MSAKERMGQDGAPANHVVGSMPKAVWSAARHAPMRQGDVPRPEILETLRAAVEGGPRVAILCAAPGMGKTVLAETLRDEWLREGRPALSTYLCGMEANRAITRLRGIVRSYTKRRDAPKGTLALIDGLPAGDDYQLETMAALLAKLVSAGMSLVITARPEAEQVCELFPECVCLRSADLLVPFEGRRAWGPAAGEATEAGYALASRGIPALLDGLRCSCAGGDALRWDPRGASGALAEMAAAGIRDSLMDEERRVRLAMMLIGSCGFEELAAAVPRLDDAVLAALERDEPFFGVDGATASFRCAALEEDRILGACFNALRAYASDEPGLVEAVCAVLAGKGRFARMALIAEGLLPASRRTRLLLGWPAELVDAGQLDSVRTALNHSDEDSIAGRDRFRIGVARIVLSCLAGKTEPCSALRAELGFPIDAREQAMLAQADAFLEAFSPQDAPAEPCMPAKPDAIVSGLRTHAQVRKLVFTGQYEEAYRQALLGGARRSKRNLVASLLADDLVLTRLLAGDAAPGEEADRAFGSFLMRPGFRNLRRLRMAELEAVCALRGGPCDQAALEEGLKAAQLRGDGSAAAFFLIAGAMLDLGGSAFARASIRSEEAARLARQAGCRNLVLEAEALQTLAEHCAGGELPRDASELNAIAELRPECALAFALAAGDAARARAYAGLLDPKGPRASGLALLRTVAALSRRQLVPLMPRLPEAWARSLDTQGGPAPRMAPAAEPVEPRRQGALVQAEVLGGFAVRREGVPIPESAWKRQSSRTLLALLCAAKGHELTRSSLCSMIWPDRDFSVARSSLYAALSTLKRALGQTADGPQAIVAREGRVVLDAAIVSSDVDELVATAVRVVAQKDDDASIIERCRGLERLKPLELPCVDTDPTGIMVARRDELASLYTDAMLVGAEAALRMRLPAVASRFALIAAACDPTREDAELLVLKSLAASGREVEARVHYERFSRLLIELTDAPPSPLMRREAARICGGVRRVPPEPSLSDLIVEDGGAELPDEEPDEGDDGPVGADS